jgi:DNA-binding NarL/FixJ family response regulator
MFGRHTCRMLASTSWSRSVLLIEDHRALRVALSGLLVGRGFEVTSAKSAHEALSLFSQCDPDVLVVDVNLGERPNGVELATLLRAKAPYIGVVFLTDYPTPASIEKVGSIPSGAAFLTKSLLESADDLIMAIETTLNDDATAVIKAKADGVNPVDQLTATQVTVARLIAMGLTNAEIARQRGSSPRAVEQVVARTFQTLGVANDPNLNPRVATAMLYTQAFGQPAPL